MVGIRVPRPGCARGPAALMAAGAQGAVAVNNGSMVLVSCRLLRSVSHGVGGAIVNREGGSLVIRDTVRALPGAVRRP